MFGDCTASKPGNVMSGRRRDWLRRPFGDRSGQNRADRIAALVFVAVGDIVAALHHSAAAIVA